MDMLKSASAATSNAFEATSSTLSSLVGSSPNAATQADDEEEHVTHPGTYARRGTVVEAISLEALEAMNEYDEVVPMDPDASNNNMAASISSMTIGGGGGGESGNERKTSKDYRKHDLNGIIWHIVVVADDFSHAAHVTPTGELKLKRPFPQIRCKDFFPKLEKETDEDGAPRWVFRGVPGGLNGWPALTYDLEVLSVTGKVRSRISPVKYVKRFWDKVAQNKEAKANKKGYQRTSPTFPKGLHTVRVTVMGPQWAKQGYSEQDPGLVFWSTTAISPRLDSPPPTPPPVEPGYPPSVPGATSGAWTAKAFPKLARLPDGAAVKCLFGTQILKGIKDGSMYPASEDNDPTPPVMHMTSVTHYAHRYAVEHESAKDKITYHAGCLIHWDHARFSTIVELAWVFGVGGYAGKANWFHDRDCAGSTSLNRAIPPEMVAPWDNHRSEIRCYDVPLVDQDDLNEYFKRYTGVKERFLVPAIVGNAPVRLSHRTQYDLAQYLLNYVGNYGAYHEESRNCQTFAADLYGFLAGKKHILPYSKVIRVLYKPRPYLFMYDPKIAPVEDEDETALSK